LMRVLLGVRMCAFVKERTIRKGNKDTLETKSEALLQIGILDGAPLDRDVHAK
jgi:hypothetical protein